MISVQKIRTAVSEFNRKSSEVAQSAGACRGRIYLSMVYCLFRYGARPIDYERFEFHKKSARERNRYMTIMRYFKVVKKIDRATFKEISGCKKRELEVFAPFIHRDWMTLDARTEKDRIVAFVNDHGRVIAKPEHGEQGRGVMLLTKDDGAAVDTLFSAIKQDDYILEACVENADYIKRINPTSLNTVRATTFIDKDGHTRILSIILRVGAPGAFVDNWGAGGVGYIFDIYSGICYQPGIDKKNRKYLLHPGSGVQMVGFKLEGFEALKEYVLALARVLPKARYVGWDIAITPHGFELIEMNCPAGHDMFQSFGTPCYDIIKKNW